MDANRRVWQHIEWFTLRYGHSFEFELRRDLEIRCKCGKAGALPDATFRERGSEPLNVLENVPPQASVVITGHKARSGTPRCGQQEKIENRHKLLRRVLPQLKQPKLFRARAPLAGVDVCCSDVLLSIDFVLVDKLCVFRG
jgi:hypothetical protein